MSKFREELEKQINMLNMESESDTLDFILARHLENCLLNFDKTVFECEKWHSRKLPRIPVGLSASEVVFSFASWLTTQPTRIIASSMDSAAVMVSLVVKFCDANHFAEPREGWADSLVHPAENGDCIRRE